MPKAYWITTYFEIKNPVQQAQYAALAGPAITAQGGRILARGAAAHTFEGGENQRTVVIEFDSVAHAVETYHSDAYQAAVAHLQGAVDREVRIVEAIVP